MFEYCVTNGKGTLIDYGVLNQSALAARFHRIRIGSEKPYRFTAMEVYENCETGK